MVFLRVFAEILKVLKNQVIGGWLKFKGLHMKTQFCCTLSRYKAGYTSTQVVGGQLGGRYQPTLELPIGHITRPCAITKQPEN